MTANNTTPATTVASDEVERNLRLRLASTLPYLDTPFAQVLLRHPARTLAMAGTLAVTYKILIAARFDTSIAMAIASAGPPPTLLLGVLIGALPALMPLVIGWGVGSVLARQRLGQPWGGSLLLFALGTMLALAILPFAQVLSLAGVLGLWVATEPVGRFFERRLERRVERPAVMPRPRRGSGRALVEGVLLVGVTLWVLVYPSMWLPQEVISVEGSGSRVGYVVAIDGGWATLLRESDRSIEYVRESAISSRTLCRPSGFKPTLPEILSTGRVPSLPPCS